MGKLNNKYGWIPDIPDHRDYIYKPTLGAESILPPMIDLRPNDPSIYDQGQLGSCTANAIAAAIEHNLKNQNKKIFTPSRLFIYYNERVMEGTVKYDNGAYIRDGIKSVNTLGVCHETTWKYDISKFKRKPIKTAFNSALKNKTILYQRINQSLYDMKYCLYTGFPIVIGFSVYTSFETNNVATTGIVPMPGTNEQLLGGHAVLVVGYDENRQVWICRNSWSDKWGDKGYFYLPYNYLLNSNLSDDFWTIQSLSTVK